MKKGLILSGLLAVVILCGSWISKVPSVLVLVDENGKAHHITKTASPDIFKTEMKQWMIMRGHEGVPSEKATFIYAPTRGDAIMITVHFNVPGIPEEVGKIFKKLKPGDRIMIDHIRIKASDGFKAMSPIVFLVE